MHVHGCTYGIDTANGKPYVNTCRGRVTFNLVDDAVAFMAARSRGYIASDTKLWGSFEKDVERSNGRWTGPYMHHGDDEDED